MNVKYLLYLTLYSVLISCKKENEAPKGESYSVDIEIIQPVQNDSIYIGDTLFYQVNFHSPYNLDYTSVKIYNKSNQSLYHEEIQSKSDTIYTFNSFWVNDLTNTTELVFEAKAQKNPSESQLLVRTIKVNP